MIAKILLSAALVLSSISALYAQSYEERELKVKEMFAQIEQIEDLAAKNDMANAIEVEMIEILMEVDSFEYDFPLLDNVGCVMSSDKKIHMYSWNIILADNKIQYFALFQNREFNTIQILAQGNSYIPNVTGTIPENKWYGALYYDIIPIEYREKPMYVVFGLMPTTNGETQHKVIDVLAFSKNAVKIGASMFKRANNRKKQYRVLFEYDKLAQVSIEYNKRKKRIEYNHLVPIRQLYDGKDIFAPDETFDALVYKNDLWSEQENVKVKAKTNNRKNKGKESKKDIDAAVDVESVEE